MLSLSEKKRCQVFISCHHSDVPILRKLKSMLESEYFECFLAYDDINPGERFCNRIEREIQNCDIFLYIGSQCADSSRFCQQEIGMAYTIRKKIIPVMIQNVPLIGFIHEIQAIQGDALDVDLFDRILVTLSKEFSLSDEQMMKSSSARHSRYHDGKDRDPQLALTIEGNYLRKLDHGITSPYSNRFSRGANPKLKGDQALARGEIDCIDEELAETHTRLRKNLKRLKR